VHLDMSWPVLHPIMPHFEQTLPSEPNITRQEPLVQCRDGHTFEIRSLIVPASEDQCDHSPLNLSD
jgi:hypothetical protein